MYGVGSDHENEQKISARGMEIAIADKYHAKFKIELFAMRQWFS